MSLSIRSALRRVAIRILKIFHRKDISIRHHWVNHRIRLNLYRHRGYWWKGRSREAIEMKAVLRLVKPGDCVLELGGHIGYLTILFSDLAGPQGRVLVFEPSPDNLRYLRQNVAGLPNTQVVEKAVCDRVGQVTLYEEQLSGQNNSIVPEYEVFEAVRAGTGLAIDVTQRHVDSTTVDHEVASLSISPNFIKIDIEGAELMALQGAAKTLRDARPVIMAELSKNIPEVVDLLEQCGYVLVTPTGERLETEDLTKNLLYAFALPKEREDALRQLRAEQSTN